MFPDYHWMDHSLRYGEVNDRELGRVMLDESTDHAIMIHNLFNDQDKLFLYRVHVCLQDIDKYRYVNRAFYGEKGEDIPGNVVMYLTGILKDFAPSLYYKIVMSSDIAVRLKGWYSL